MNPDRAEAQPWANFLYVYPVVSRRAGGVSIGLNLNPAKDCNFDCIYCQIDRTEPGRTSEVRLPELERELREMISIWKSGELFRHAPFDRVPQDKRRLNDLAFSGDGEPTASPAFGAAVALADRLRAERLPSGAKLVLITDSTMLHEPGVRAALEVLRRGAHEVWAKLDAGTPALYRRVNRSRVPFRRILENLEATARWCPLVIQSLFLKIRGIPPGEREIDAYCDRIGAILAKGGQIIRIQVGTVSRPPASSAASALEDPELAAIAERIRARNGLPQQVLTREVFQVSREEDRAARNGAAP